MTKHTVAKQLATRKPGAPGPGAPYIFATMPSFNFNFNINGAILVCNCYIYICCENYPSSYSIIISSIIIFLLLMSQSNVAASSAKLALFYDWLFFTQARANIMDVGK